MGKFLPTLSSAFISLVLHRKSVQRARVLKESAQLRASEKPPRLLAPTSSLRLAQAIKQSPWRVRFPAIINGQSTVLARVIRASTSAGFLSSRVALPLREKTAAINEEATQSAGVT